MKFRGGNDGSSVALIGLVAYSSFSFSIAVYSVRNPTLITVLDAQHRRGAHPPPYKKTVLDAQHQEISVRVLIGQLNGIRADSFAPLWIGMVIVVVVSCKQAWHLYLRHRYCIAIPRY
jgi:hypothetical protein